MKKPEPINKHIVCSLCGLNWDQHGEKPTAEKCIELLKAELARRPHRQWNGWLQQQGMTSYRGVPINPATTQLGKAQ